MLSRSRRLGPSSLAGVSVARRCEPTAHPRNTDTSLWRRRMLSRRFDAGRGGAPDPAAARRLNHDSVAAKAFPG